MAAYYIDAEFLEGTQKERFPISLFRKNTPPTIDLISIAIVEEGTDAFSKRMGITDRTNRGREYYAISKDFNLKEAWNRWQPRKGQGDRNNTEPKEYWIRENVLKPIYEEWLEIEVSLIHKAIKLRTEYKTPYSPKFCYTTFKHLLNKYGKTNKQIAEEVKEFCKSYREYEIIQPITVKYSEIKKPQFYGYYSAYDHVAVCWLFGKMIDLPNGFPMLTIDLKQMLDERLKTYTSKELSKATCPSCKHNVYEAMDYEKPLISMDECIKDHPNYPKQTNEHSALHDARWNKQLHEFIKSL